MEAGFELVIFDCDGVLVDSERLANKIFAQILKEECGLQFTVEQMFDIFVGHSHIQCMEKIETMIGRPPPESLSNRYNQDINQALAQSIEAVSGIETVLAELTLPCCVASGGSHEKMKMTLGKTGLQSYFDGNIFSTSDVERSKPHPDVYLHAAAKMGVADPSRCLVVEDSPIGVTGAVAAGMTVFGFAEVMPAHKLAAQGAHQIFENMHDLPRLIANYHGVAQI